MMTFPISVLSPSSGVGSLHPAFSEVVAVTLQFNSSSITFTSWWRLRRENDLLALSYITFVLIHEEINERKGPLVFMKKIELCVQRLSPIAY